MHTARAGSMICSSLVPFTILLLCWKRCPASQRFWSKMPQSRISPTSSSAVSSFSPPLPLYQGQTRSFLLSQVPHTSFTFLLLVLFLLMTPVPPQASEECLWGRDGPLLSGKERCWVLSWSSYLARFQGVMRIKSLQIALSSLGTTSKSKE